MPDAGATATATPKVFDFSNTALYNKKYIPLFKNDAEFLHVWGSASSGKSRFIAQKEIVKSFLPERRRRKTIVARKVKDTLRESCFAELEGVIYEWGLDDCFHITTSPLQIINLITGVKFVFRGFDDVNKLKSIVGADRAWYEEATESESIEEINQLRTRLRGFKNVQVTLTYNPTDEHHYINTEIHEKLDKRPGHFLFHCTYKDNEKLIEKDPRSIAFLESTEASDPAYWRVYGLGLWGTVLEGLIYTKYAARPEFPQDGRGNDDVHWYGLDFGFSNPTALIAQHVQDAAPKKKLINKQIIYKVGLDGPGLVAEFRRQKVRKDRVIIADCAQANLIKTLRDAGYNVRPSLKFAGSVLVGINDVRSFDIEITAGSTEMLKEIRNYQKAEKHGGYVEEPAPGQVDHAMDAMRYGVQKAILPQRKGKKKPRSMSYSMFGDN